MDGAARLPQHPAMRLALLLALLLPALPAAAQETCGGAIRVERFEGHGGADGRMQVMAAIRNGGRTPLAYVAIRTPVPGLEGATPAGPHILAPNQVGMLLIGRMRAGAAIPDAALRSALTLSCRL